MASPARSIRVTSALSAALVAGASSCAAPPAARPSSGPLIALIAVTAIDPSADRFERPDQTILVAEGRIVAMGPRDSVNIPPHARRIDLAGKYVIPGLWDAHVHLMNAGVTALPVFVAHGVTSVREMGGYLDSSRTWQAQMRAGTLIGPRLITPGGMLENPRYLAGVVERSARVGGRLAPRILPHRVGVADSAAARRAIDSLRRRGVDFVKFRTVASAESFFAILREAHRAGLQVAGHNPGVVPLMVAADSGLDDIEHALGIFDANVRAAVGQRFATRRIWYTPTLVVTHAVTVPGDSAQKLIFDSGADADPSRALASAWLLGWWRMQVDERLADTSRTAAAQTQRALSASREDVRAFAAAGVRMLAGTDAGSVLVYPGASLHDELSMLVDAGLTPQQALWSATAGPAQFARLDSIVGRIAAGQVADLVVLDANPLRDIRNTRRIHAVVQAGRVHGRAALDSLLASVRAQNSR